jgi:hypothetical protein
MMRNMLSSKCKLGAPFVLLIFYSRFDPLFAKLSYVVGRELYKVGKGQLSTVKKVQFTINGLKHE